MSLETYRESHRYCETCQAMGLPVRRARDIHHIRTRGAGGTDEDWNLLALCRDHHAELHIMGCMSFGLVTPVLGEKIRAAREKTREVKK